MKHCYIGIITILFFFSPSFGQQEDSLRMLYEKGDCEAVVAQVMGSSNDSLSAQVCFISGICLMEQSEYQLALAYLDLAVRKDHDMAMGYFMKAEALLQLGRFSEALIQYDNAIYLEPEVPDFQLGKGHALFQVGRYSEAIFAFQEALSFPDCPEKVYVLLARAYQENKEMDLALSTYYRALEVIDPQGEVYHECFHRLGQTEYLLGNYEAAEQVYIRLLSTNPEDYKGVSKLIQVYFAQGAYEKGKAQKMLLYSAYNRGLLPDYMVKNGFCFDQFIWEDKRVYAFERFEEPSGHYVKHLFLVTDEKDHLLEIIQTEHRPEAAILDKKYVLARKSGDQHTLFEAEVFDDNFDYAVMKRAVIRILRGKPNLVRGILNPKNR